MAEIKAALVKELRERTGAGMMDCKRALAETAGDLEAAVDQLRKKGLAAAAKKAGRQTSEGLVGISVQGRVGACVEVNSETDFVARNEAFQELVRRIAALAPAARGDLDALRLSRIEETGRTVEEEIVRAVGLIGENLSLRRTAAVEVGDGGVVGSYLHGQLSPGLGRIAVLVGLEGGGANGAAAGMAELGRQLAMHVAAANPQAVDIAALDPAVVEREKAIYADQARATGKPDNIALKMAEGRLRKFYEESVLLEQVYVVDTEKRVKQVVEAAGKDLGAPVRVSGFVRMALGEGIDKRPDDFAAEVAQLSGA